MSPQTARAAMRWGAHAVLPRAGASCRGNTKAVKHSHYVHNDDVHTPLAYDTARTCLVSERRQIVPRARCFRQSLSRCLLSPPGSQAHAESWERRISIRRHAGRGRNGVVAALAARAAPARCAFAATLRRCFCRRVCRCCRRRCCGLAALAITIAATHQLCATHAQ